MRASSFRYLTKQGVKSLWSNRMMTLASVGVLTACLLIVGFAVLLTENINNMVHFVESQNEFKAFMMKEEDYITLQKESGETPFVPSDEVTDGTTSDWDLFLQSVQKELEALPNVAKVTFVSKDEGIEDMKEQLGAQGSLLDDYVGSENPLRDSFTIKVDDLSKLTETTQKVQEIEGIYNVTYASEAAKTLTSIRNIVNVVGWAIVAALVIVSLVIITNTIRATIFSRRKELNIMKYVGATNSFVRLPFIVEGICLGLLAAVLAYGIIYLGYTSVINSFADQASAWLQSAFENVIPFRDIAGYLAIFFGASSVGIGVLGSAVSIRNHIKV